jgi:glycosyltransferase involved in cell wall biosynthesis
MMKVLYWTDFSLPVIGGVEIFSAKLIPALQKRGYQIFVATSDTNSTLLDPVSRPWMDETVSIYRFPFWEALQTKDIKQTIAIRRQITRLKTEIQPDLIHIHFGATTYFHLQTLSAYPSKILTTIHSCPTASLSSASLLHQALQSTNWVNTVSSKTLTDIRQVIPEVTSRSSVIYCGIESPNLIPKPITFDPPHLLCLGRVVPQKGFDVAIRALALLVKTFPNIRLTIAGDGSEKSILEEQVRDLELLDRVDFMGWVTPDRIQALLNEATISILPSRAEGLPLVALQSAQMARPIVATNVDGLPEIVVDRKTGLLVEKDDSLAVAEAITFLLQNPTVAIKLGQAAQQRVQNHFSFQNSVDRYDELYQKLLSQTPI